MIPKCFKRERPIQINRCPSFPMGELGTFALFELPTFLWETFIKMRVIFLKCYKVLIELCLYILDYRYLPNWEL